MTACQFQRYNDSYNYKLTKNTGFTAGINKRATASHLTSHDKTAHNFRLLKLSITQRNNMLSTKDR